jgi:HemY protein
MKTKLIIGLLLAIGGVVLLELVRRDSGYVLISYGTKTFETSLWFAVSTIIFFLCVVIIVFWLLIFLWRTIWGGVNWVGQQRNHAIEQKYRVGLLHFLTGNWMEARKALSSGGAKNLPVIRTLAAAEALDHQREPQKAIALLENGEQKYPQDVLWLRTLRVKKLIQHQQLSQASALLIDLEKMAPEHAMNAELRFVLLQKQKQWQQALELLPKLKLLGLYSKDELTQLEQDLHRRQLEYLLERADLNASMVEKTWHSIPKPLKKQLPLIECYAQLLFKVRNFSPLRELIEYVLADNWSPKLLHLYGALDASNAKQQLEKSERWLVRGGDDPELHLVIGKLAAKNQLWGKAKASFQKSLALAPSAEAYRELGELCESLGEKQESIEWFKKAAYL